ncbi:MAG: neurotransmitter-gated ion-channel ligand-binding protein [Reyranella sp.]|nr:neurotransmitter-gated ion-channel ligand-binding protein [Reyranella sp.]
MGRLRVFVALIGLIASVGSARAQTTDLPPLPRGVELPIQVRLSVRILNVTRVLETTGELGASIEYTQRWTDPGLRFDAVAQGTQHLDFSGPAAEARLAKMWQPGIAIDDMIGSPRAASVALSIYSDGRVVLIRRLDADFRVSVDMSSFPFDIQRFLIRFSTPRHANHEVVITTTEFDRSFSTIAGELSVNNWRSRNVGFRQDTFYGWNARPFSRMTFVVTVQRSWTRYILRMFVPFIAIMSLSLFILWAPETVLASNQRAPLVFTTLLALAALSFTFEASFPGSISMNSPIATMISMGYFYLPAVLVIDVFLSLKNSAIARRYPYLLPEMRRNLRLTVPVLFFGLCLIALALSGTPTG